ncbi:phasin family protein [Polynucleobacter sp. AP-Latsch-80-C2]|jgi:signal transduction histidine kinase|uniref:phasin family protein n=1 Tax=Polynucleobacter sp. AP-Latsch-80-C2 TaxID=2576931 RepID=UPI001C0D2C73|nr:phasin family protein [Polynucleobacter sp. AP-Latsch-80-C2]MBU3623790.1 phasin family protein [Polynucleobacter sp. AP-Latsch-80-C2]
MSKNPFELNGMPGQEKVMQATKDASAVAMESAQAINLINQQAAQELATRIQKRVAELMKTQDPKSAFDYVHAEVLQDAAKEVTAYQQKLMKVLNQSNKELAEIAESMIEESKVDLIHFVNDATNNAPMGSEAYVSVFKTSFNTALQNFELIRAAMADSFSNFEKSVENVTNLASSQATGKKKS